MGLGTIFLLILILLLVGSMPSWGNSKRWGFWPSGSLGLVGLLVVMLLFVESQ